MIQRPFQRSLSKAQRFLRISKKIKFFSSPLRKKFQIELCVRVQDSARTRRTVPRMEIHTRPTHEYSAIRNPHWRASQMKWLFVAEGTNLFDAMVTSDRTTRAQPQYTQCCVQHQTSTSKTSVTECTDRWPPPDRRLVTSKLITGRSRPENHGN